MKKLASLTIIPDELYVERSADAQLRQVIDDMGRPAYVLVARQMGKTNLLLHAKRTCQCPGDLFVYLDVSNPLETVSEFFNSVVDAMIDSGRLNNAVAVEIHNARRESMHIAAHRLHERELRTILNAISGKIVIFLDEVDALGSRQYSDQVFAYIRSVYFAARTNFPEFNRLSYVLSGVAEPSELIKNKDISPFNIGQKIYLDDFTKEEFFEFCEKAELQLDRNVKERVYWWTSGNPRMSWDLLANLQPDVQSGAAPTEALVDSAVWSLYFETFDVPPVDHIRNLVEKDEELQAALMSLHFGKLDAIPSHVQNKLYLAGIAKLNATSGSIELKNRIIADSLSEHWIQELEGKNVTPIERAYSAYGQGRWADALILLQESFETTEEDAVKAQIASYIGVCLFRTQMYQDAVHWIEKHIPKKHVFAALHYAMSYWLGLAYHALGNIDKSYAAFLTASEPAAEGVNTFYYECLVNRCAYYLKDVEQHHGQIESIVQLILDSHGKLEDTYTNEPAAAAHVRCSAYWHLATLRKRQGRKSEALDQLAFAMEQGDKKFSVGIALERARLQESGPARWDVASEMAATLIEQGYVLEPDHALFHLAFTLTNASELLSLLAMEPDREVLSRFLIYLRELLLDSPNDYVGAVSQAAGIALNSGSGEGASKLFRAAYETNGAGVDEKLRRIYATNALLLGSWDKSIDLVESYINEYFVPEDARLVATDFRLLYSIFFNYLKDDWVRASELVRIVRPLVPNFLFESKETQSYDSIAIGALVFDSFDIELSNAANKSSEASLLGINWLDRAQKLKAAPPPSYFSSDILESVANRVRRIAYSSTIQPFVRNYRKIGRNEIVTVVTEKGEKRVGKYKKFESEIKTGDLILKD